MRKRRTWRTLALVLVFSLVLSVTALATNVDVGGNTETFPTEDSGGGGDHDRPVHDPHL